MTVIRKISKSFPQAFNVSFTSYFVDVTDLLIAMDAAICEISVCERQ